MTSTHVHHLTAVPEHLEPVLATYAESMGVDVETALTKMVEGLLQRVFDDGMRTHQLTLGPHASCRRCGVRTRALLAITPCI